MSMSSVTTFPRSSIAPPRRLHTRPNVRLVAPHTSSHELIRRAEAIAVISSTVGLEALLYEKRYSLLFEGGHYWIDTRRYGFDAPPSEGGLIFVDPAPNDLINSQFPIPINEQLARQE